MALVTFWLLLGTCFYLATTTQQGNNMPVAPTPLSSLPVDSKLASFPSPSKPGSAPISFPSMPPGGVQMPPLQGVSKTVVVSPGAAPGAQMPLTSLPGISRPIGSFQGVSKALEPAAAPVQPISEVDRHQLDLINMPPNFSQKYLDFDPCLSSPCMFGRICQSMPEVPAGFVCLNEIDMNKEVSDARVIYRNMELLAKEAVVLNVETITNHGVPPFGVGPVPDQQQQQFSTLTNSQGQHVLLNLKVQKPVKLTCEPNPCQMNEKCVPKPNSVEGFSCVKERISVVEEENSKIISKLLDDNTFIADASKRCESSEAAGQRLEIVQVPTHFISCLDQSDFTIQSCPQGLVFNKHLDRCDVDQEPMSTGCGSSPCQFGAQCHDLPHLDYMCECAKGFSGKNCEVAPDVCATAPCGHADGNVCHVLPSDTGLRYFCTCFKGRAFGLSCEESQVERNPCETDSTQLNTVFSTRIGPSVFGLCDEDRKLNLRMCDKQMQAIGECKWLTRLGLQRDRRAIFNNNWMRKNF